MLKNPINKPNFFFVGAPKTGSTFIAKILNKHPDIYICPIKEPHFFSKDFYDFRVDYQEKTFLDIKAYLNIQPLQSKHLAHIQDEVDYLELFKEVNKEIIIGELSTGYLYSNCAAENIYKFNPNAKIIMILRQPIERAFSHYLMDVAGLINYDDDDGFINALKRDLKTDKIGWGKSHLYVELGLYFEQVNRYLKIFPKNKIKIFLYDEFKNNTLDVMQEIYEFLEVDTRTLISEYLTFHENVAISPKLKIRKSLLPFYKIIKSNIRRYFPDSIKRHIKNKMLSSTHTPKLQLNEFNACIDYFSADIKKLSILIEKDLQHWLHMDEK